MLEVTVEQIGDVLTCLLFRIPGAFIRWVVLRKKTLRAYFYDRWEDNCIVVFMVLLPLLIVVSSGRQVHYI